MPVKFLETVRNIHSYVEQSNTIDRKRILSNWVVESNKIDFETTHLYQVSTDFVLEKRTDSEVELRM